MADLRLAFTPISELSANPRNARTHSARQIKQISESIRSFGFVSALLVDENGEIIGGHGRLEAAQQLGLETVPTIGLHGLSAAQKRALAIADNKIALNAGWDLEILAAELADLSEMSLDFSLDATGFDVGEIDLVIEQGAGSIAPEPEIVPEPDHDLPRIARRGDLWALGQHRVLCGDALSVRDMNTLMEDQRASAGFTDPPYNVPIQGHVTGNGKVQHREFEQASGEMSSEEFAVFLRDALENSARVSRNGAVWFTCMDWRHLNEMMEAGRSAFDTHLNLCVWAKTNGGMGSLYRSQHELVFVWRKGKTGHRNNVQLGRFGRNRTNVWTYPGVNTFRPGRLEELKAHPTAKPVAMVKDAILDVSRRGDIVLDPFLGAGSTLIAAQRSGRRALGMELDPLYVDACIRRWQLETEEVATRISDGRTFYELEESSSLGEVS